MKRLKLDSFADAFRANGSRVGDSAASEITVNVTVRCDRSQSIPGKVRIDVGGTVDSLIDWKSFADMERGKGSSDLVGEGSVSVEIAVTAQNELGDSCTGETLSRSLDGLRTGTGRSSSCWLSDSPTRSISRSLARSSSHSRIRLRTLPVLLSASLTLLSRGPTREFSAFRV